MFFNSGTLLFILILLGSMVLLLLLLLLLGILGRKGKKLVGLRVLTMLFAIATVTSGVLTTLVYYNYIDLNLRLSGRYSDVNGSHTYLKFHRDQAELHVDGNSEGTKGKWYLANDVLTITYNGNKEEYTVKDFGTKLYQGDTLMYKFTKN
ncbi:MAG: hypothetical protein K5925_00400 [Bacilli bacterium]|nr:hypothetical protein [Bacilli bacterium]